MWGKPPFEVAESFVVEVSNLEAARDWYNEKLGFQDASNDVPDDSGKPYLALALSGDVPEIALMERAARVLVGMCDLCFLLEICKKRMSGW